MVPSPGLLDRPRRLGTVRSSPLVSIGTPLEPALVYGSSVSHVSDSTFSCRLQTLSIIPLII